jgi:hypothetical protein
MPRKERRRQKALEKKKKRRETRSPTSESLVPEGRSTSTSRRAPPSFFATSPNEKKRLIRRATEFPIHECLLDPEWQEKGLGQFLISRRQPNGNLLFGVYLVDVFCLGVKNTFCNADMSPREYERSLKARIFAELDVSSCSPLFFHQVIYGALDYASGIGLNPHKDFGLSRCILEPRSEIPPNPELEFGKDGQPFFISGPNDNVQRIFRILDARVGQGNYHFLVGAPADLMS